MYTENLLGVIILVTASTNFNDQWKIKAFTKKLRNFNTVKCYVY